MTNLTLHEVKRYSNRKLYSKTLGKYITLVDIYNLNDNNIKVVVTNHDNDKDVTAETLLKAEFFYQLAVVNS